MADSTTYKHYTDQMLADLIPLYLEGIKAVQDGHQSYSMGGVSITRANLETQEKSLGFMLGEQAFRRGDAGTQTEAYRAVRRRVGGGAYGR